MDDEETSEERLPQAAVSKQIRDAELASSAADDVRAQELPQDLTKVRLDTRMTAIAYITKCMYPRQRMQWIVNLCIETSKAKSLLQATCCRHLPFDQP